MTTYQPTADRPEATTRAEALAEHAARRAEHAHTLDAYDRLITEIGDRMDDQPPLPLGGPQHTLERVQISPLDAARTRAPKAARAYRAATWTPPGRGRAAIR